MDDSRAKVREALEHAKHAMACPMGGRAQWLCMHATLEVNEALALLDAEDKPSVPMAMIDEATHGAYHQWSEAEKRDLAARYGFQVKEIDDGL